MDPHWIPQVYNCMPCAVNYSFIIAFENLAKDSKHLLDYLQRNMATNITLQPSGPSQTSQEITQQAFGLLSEKQVEALREIYADDFYIFGYDPLLYRGHK